jgi:lipooligosaccharide transport system permease protein
MLPMYLFATTFYPLSTYPGWLRPMIQALPLYQSIELIRGPALGRFEVPALAFAVCYLAGFVQIAGSCQAGLRVVRRVVALGLRSPR